MNEWMKHEENDEKQQKNEDIWMIKLINQKW